MFAGTSQPVPQSLLNRDVADCCFEHLSKLARTILRFAETFPFHSCPARALTPEGVAALGLDLESIEAALGFPPEFSSVRPEGTIDDRTRLYRRYVDEVRFDEIQRIAHYMPEQPSDGANSAVSFAQTMVQQIELSRSTGMAHETAVRVAIASEILRRNSGVTRNPLTPTRPCMQINVSLTHIQIYEVYSRVMRSRQPTDSSLAGSYTASDTK